MLEQLITDRHYRRIGVRHPSTPKSTLFRVVFRRHYHYQYPKNYLRNSSGFWARIAPLLYNARSPYRHNWKTDGLIFCSTVWPLRLLTKLFR
ncbi:hypothetical protein Zmor_026781 [Zophobas morio]|uniref:Uncharacterized protein n=1 Tax=Zophobas morio TaxID=2755281 RepID=A0AA38M5Q3_9CUCU|nr:hypothetical protein Zmor_026781 [Zophobas morio]